MTFKLPGLAKGNVSMRDHGFLAQIRGAMTARKIIKQGKKSRPTARQKGRKIREQMVSRYSID